SCITASTAESPAPGGGTLRSLTGDQNTTAVLSRAQNLPLVVLEKICSYLPFPDQSRCAQVCRHWHGCLPAPGLRLAQWLQKNAPLSCQAEPGLGSGFSSRALPFLQAANSPALPTLMHLHQQQQQDTQPLAAGPAACDLLSAMVHQVLNEHLTQADQLSLQPAAIDWPDEALVETYNFSPCSRWLAIRCRPQDTGPVVLRLFGWEHNFWQRQTLVSCGAESVDTFTFAFTPQDRLLSFQGSDILAWCREPDTNNWHPRVVDTLAPFHRVLTFYPMADGDLATPVKSRPSEGRLYIQFYVYTGDGSGWKPAAQQEVPGSSCCTALEGKSCQVALSWVGQSADQDCSFNKIVIWRKGLDTSHPALWGQQVSNLPHDGVDIRELAYGPGGQCLLGVLNDGQACLWTLDAQCHLHRQLTLAGNPCPLRSYLSRQVAFRSDGKQLAFPCYRNLVQLCEDTHGRWQCTQLLETPEDPEIPAEDRLRYLLLSSSGRILLRVSHWRLDVWHQTAAGGWQHQLTRKRGQQSRFMATGYLLPPGELVCTAVQDPHLSLWIHGLDSRGQFVKKACIPVNALMGKSSPDGLSLLVGSRKDPPTLLQLSLLPQENREGRAQEPVSAERAAAQEQQGENHQAAAQHGGCCRLL
ncbi:MAG: F-box-like domain-containing protein, partial [Kistimonas sp.]|nr:F-box-like domain-containing protein [Kistimonas sp.]